MEKTIATDYYINTLANNVGLDPKAQARNAELWEKVFDRWLDKGASPELAAKAACDAVTLREMARQHGYGALQPPKDEQRVIAGNWAHHPYQKTNGAAQEDKGAEAMPKSAAPNYTINVVVSDNVSPEDVRRFLDKWFADHVAKAGT